MVLIALISLVWMWQMSPAPPTEPPTSQEEPVLDTSEAVAQERARARELLEDPTGLQAEGDSLRAQAQDTTAQDAQAPPGRIIVVETDLYEATFSTRGATLTSFVLKNYNEYDRETPVQLVDTTRQGALSLVFTTPQSRNLDTRTLSFETAFAGDTLRVKPVEDRADSLRAAGEEDTADSLEQVAGEEAAVDSLTFTAQVGQGMIRQTYVFYPETYEVGLRVAQTNAASYMTSAGYDVVWHGGLPFTEADPETEAAAAGAYARTGGGVVSLGLGGEDTAEQTLRGDVSWTAVKNKYFTAALLTEQPARGAILVGETVERDSLVWEDYVTRLQMARPEGPESARRADVFSLYLGPVDYSRLSSFGADLYAMVDYGWDFFEWMTRPFAKYFFIPMLGWLHGLIPSYGIAIILLAIIVKMAVYPLTKSSYKSMAKMRELQPRMEEIKEKHGDNPQKQQEAMMKMYKETGVNPIGGCLPMLLQYPIIIALWMFLPVSIDIRQESFLWANDLSVPDVILNLPFEIPFYGDYVAGFTLLMGLSMVVQMRIQTGSTGASAGQMKALTYIFPFMIFFIFNRFASALSLYYLAYNIVTAIQQKWINHQIEKEDEGKASTNGKGSKADAEVSWFRKLART